MEKCDVCKKEKVQNQFYNRISGICKECVQDEFIEIVKNNGGRIKKPLFELCKKYNLPYIEQILENIKRDLSVDRKWEGKQARFIVSSYMRDITVMRQYEHMVFNDGESEVFADFVIEIEDVIETKTNLTKADFLEHERLELQVRLTQSLNKSDIGTYKNLIQAYERILMLQSQEDKTSSDEWVQMYSKYKTMDDNEKPISMVAIWEQKGKEIRRHRMFEVKREVKYNDTYGAKSETGEKKFLTEYNFGEID